MQIHDFIRIYEAKTDEELLQIAGDVAQLTPEAQDALQSELSRRGLHGCSGSMLIQADRRVDLPVVVHVPFMQTHDFLYVYESKTDEELLLIARDVDDLIPEARPALHSELSRRGLKG